MPSDHSHHHDTRAPACCATGTEHVSTLALAGPHAHHSHGGGPLLASMHATLHCLTGCIIGEVIGVAIGVTLGLDIGVTILLATVLAYTTGFTLGVLPVMKSQQLSFLSALKLIWLGEAVSIGVMEIVMNFVDYSMGGMGAPSIFHWSFWQGFLFAAPAGFLAAWPVNWWLLSRNIKQKCH